MMMQNRTTHYLVVEADPEDEEALAYRVECGGVTDACRRYEDCIPDAVERNALDYSPDQKPVAHGKRHVMVDASWCAETTACNVAEHDGLADAVADRFPIGRHEIDWDFGDGTELVLVAMNPASKVLRPYRFTGGPWDGKTVQEPRAFSGPGHCMPTAPDVPGGGTWAAADSWPGRNRYAPDGTDGDVVLMTWRLPTGAELDGAKVRREIRDEERLQEYALDAAADAAAGGV